MINMVNDPDATNDDSEDGLLQFDETYSFIEGISDSESDGSAHEIDQQSVSTDEFYDDMMGEI